MANRNYQEKDEKDEKEMDKREEKTFEEKWRRDPLSTIIWAAIFIWAGLVFLADNLNLVNLKLDGRFGSEFGPFSPGVWSVVVIGAGVIVLIEVGIRLLMPAYRQPVGGSLIFAAVLIGIGLGNIYGWDLVWPLILIAVGLSFVLRGFSRRKKE
jgi:hypothetical protein